MAAEIHDCAVESKSVTLSHFVKPFEEETRLNNI
jgi:hypothetical protein